MMTGSSDVIIPTAVAEAEEVFALHWAETLLGSAALARLIPSEDTAANNDRFSVYWRSSARSLGANSVAHGETDASSNCHYVDITIQFQKKLSPSSNTPSVEMNVQFGSFWTQQSSSPPQESRFLYTVLRADPSVSSSQWFAHLRRDHFRSLGIDVAATPGPVLARLWGRAWREWTPEQADWKDPAPSLYLRYPPEFARSRVPFPLFDDDESQRRDPHRIPGRFACETVPVQMAESIVLQHCQQSLLLPPAFDTATPDASTIESSAVVTSDEPKQTTSCWDLYWQWKKQSLASPEAMNPTVVVAEVASTEATPSADATTSSEPAPASPPSTEMTTADTTAAVSVGPSAKRRRIVRPNAPRRAPLPATRPPGNRFV